MSEFSDYKEHLEHDLDSNEFLGSLVFYTVPQLTVSYDTVKRELKAVGLDAALPKNPPADSDVFRRVFLNGERRKIRTGNDESHRLLIREVSSTHERLIKRIVAEDVDGNNRRLAYAEAVEVEFNKNHPQDIKITPLSFDQAALDLANDLAGAYRTERGHLDGNAMRAIVVKCLDTCNATSVREGGSVYFVSSDHNKQVEALESLAGQIGQGMLVHSLPLLDDRKQRSFVRECFRQEAVTDVQRIVAEVVTLLKSGDKITQKKFAALNSKYVQARGKVQEYQKLLNDEKAITDTGIDVLGQHMANLFDSLGLGTI